MRASRMLLPAIVSGWLAVGTAYAQSPLDRLFPLPPSTEPGIAETARGARTLAEHAATFSDPAQASALLTAWGWEANAYQLIGHTGASVAKMHNPGAGRLVSSSKRCIYTSGIMPACTQRWR
jgi:hypothetical protein